jgi:nucleoid DNA-binding protein
MAMTTGNSTGATRPRTISKSEFVSQMADRTGLSKADVKKCLDGMREVIGKQLARKGPGVVAIPGLCRITRIRKAAVKGGVQRANPFKPGEFTISKARPAHNVVRVRPLKGLKAMVES